MDYWIAKRMLRQQEAGVIALTPAEREEAEAIVAEVELDAGGAGA